MSGQDQSDETAFASLMHLDVQDLRNFYYRSRVGRAAQGVIRTDLQRAWPRTEGMTVAGFGFAAPLLRPFLADARRVTALMPGPQGCLPWPPGQPNVSVLCEDTLWPLGTGTVDLYGRNGGNSGDPEPGHRKIAGDFG